MEKSEKKITHINSRTNKALGRLEKQSGKGRCSLINGAWQAKNINTHTHTHTGKPNATRSFIGRPRPIVFQSSAVRPGHGLVQRFFGQLVDRGDRLLSCSTGAVLKPSFRTTTSAMERWSDGAMERWNDNLSRQQQNAWQQQQRWLLVQMPRQISRHDQFET